MKKIIFHHESMSKLIKEAADGPKEQFFEKLIYATKFLDAEYIEAAEAWMKDTVGIDISKEWDESLGSNTYRIDPIFDVVYIRRDHFGGHDKTWKVTKKELVDRYSD